MGTEFEKDNIIKTSPEDEDLMLPEGYGAEDSVFADPTDQTDEQADESADPDEDEEDGAGDGAEDAPTTAQKDAQDVSGKDNAETPTTESAAPTTAQEKAESASNMLKFKAKFNSQEQDVELNANDLPGIWQKAQNHDRMQSRYNEQQDLVKELESAAKSLGYANAKEMAQKIAGAYQEAEVKSLMASEGIPERIAKAVVAQEMAQRGAVPSAPVPQNAAPAKRDPKAEVDELLQARPDLYGKALPQEVLVAAQAGKKLLLAYTEYESRKAAQEAAKLQQEENIQKQNAANAAKAPVRGTASGGAPKKETGEDDFLKGFNSEY